MEHEEGLPEDAVPFLVERLEHAFARCEDASAANSADAFDELGVWLVKSYQFYLTRLLSCSSEAPWCFAFPKSEFHTHH